MFAKIVQKWNAFKANWKEYKRLRRLASRAWHKLDQIRYKITVHYSADDIVKIKRCIHIKIVNVPVIDPSDDFGGRKMGVVALDSYCPHFNGTANDGSSAPCTETQCPCYAGYCEYIAAAKEYAAAAERRRAFWDSNVKQKRK